MPFQSTVNQNLAAGIPGELAFDDKTRARTFIINSADPTQNVFGRAFTFVSGGTGSMTTSLDPAAPIAQAGNPAGTAVFAGILVWPKEEASFGTAAGGPLAPTLTLQNGVTAALLDQGAVYCSVSTVANPGDWVYMTNATGAITTTAPAATAPAASTRIANAVVGVYVNNPAGVCVIKLGL